MKQENLTPKDIQDYVDKKVKRLAYYVKALALVVAVGFMAILF